MRPLARAIGMPQGTLFSAATRKRSNETKNIFAESGYAFLIEKITNGQVKAYDLCPKMPKLPILNIDSPEIKKELKKNSK